MNKKKTIFALGALAGVSITYFSLCQRLYNNVLKGHNKPAKTKDETDYSVLDSRRQAGQVWAETTEHAIVYISSFDHLKLAGYQFLNPGSDKWVIIVHGYQSEAKYVFQNGKEFYDRGFNVLIVDCRGHGLSEGDYIGMGWHDRLDIVKWIEHVLLRYPSAQIVLYGISMGAATVMMTTGENLPSNVVCAIEDCGYSNLYDVFADQIKRLYHLPPISVLAGIDCVMRSKAGYSIGEVDAIKQLRKSKTPTLFIHGQEDDFVPFTMVFENYNACAAPKEIITASRAGHALSQTKPYYYLKVFEFIDHYIK